MNKIINSALSRFMKVFGLSGTKKTGFKTGFYFYFTSMFLSGKLMMLYIRITFS